MSFSYTGVPAHQQALGVFVDGIHRVSAFFHMVLLIMDELPSVPRSLDTLTVRVGSLTEGAGCEAD